MENSKILLKKASLKAIKFACKNYHYSKSVPVNPIVYSVFNNNEFCGVIIFGLGANNNLSKTFGLVQGEIVELTRVALNGKQNKTSQVVAIALRLIKKHIPTAKLCVSYADLTNQNHKGTIYKASNWDYLGKRIAKSKGAYYIIKGKLVHGRTVRAKYGNEKNIPFDWEYAPQQEKFMFTYRLNWTKKEYQLCVDSLKAKR